MRFRHHKTHTTHTDCHLVNLETKWQNPAMADWITTDEALEIGRRDYQQVYHVEYLRQLMRAGKVVGQKFGRTWQVNRRSWIDYLEESASSTDSRRGGRPPESES